MCRMSVQVTFVQRRHDAGFEPIAHLGEARRLCGHFLVAEFAGFAEANDQRDGKGPRTHAALVPAAVHLRGDPNPRVFLSHVQRTDALRTVHLVGRERDQSMPMATLHIDGNLAHALNRIDMEEAPPFFGDRADLRDRIDVPISLFASMIETSIVLSVMARRPHPGLTRSLRLSTGR